MLSEDEMRQIRAEELFRLEVRRELEAARPHPTAGQRLWSWLNSAFGLWLLSSVVLTGLTSVYAHYRDATEQAHKNEQLKRRLLVEITGRMNEATHVLEKYRSDIDQGTFGAPADIYGSVVNCLDNSFLYDPNDRQDLSIYPEFQKRNIQSLLYEYGRLDVSEHKAADQAVQDYFRFKDQASRQSNFKVPADRRRACLNAVEDAERTLMMLKKGLGAEG